ncbi:hypothetical protein COU53_02955 [Candidatus Pacearchaeota archaeon CG10_big_fil_rev_8_21_14_0_10_30_48]|nr:MAG: hypothetical protein COU53_02955 [Candidatus Pacearchaeota archaeon CG10_big_fil_rev_8_21_14_0_10_30_48]
MKYGKLFGLILLIFIMFGIFVSADITIFEVDETSPIAIQEDFNIENNKVNVNFISKDMVRYSINENIVELTEIGGSYRDPYHVSYNVSLMNIYIHTPAYVGDPIEDSSFVTVRIGKEFNLTLNNQKKILIFDGKSYEIELGNYFSVGRANFKINGIESPILATWSSYKLPNESIYITLNEVTPNYSLPPPPSSFSTYTVTFTKEYNLTEEDAINFQFIDKPDDKSNISLEDAKINILCNKTDTWRRVNNIDTYFKLKNNRNEQFNSVMYLKSDGLICYSGDCYEPNDFDLNSAFIHINGEYYYNIYILDIEGNKFLAFNYSFNPNEEIEVEIGYMEIALPFKYYLDSLSSYQTAKHEKITIEGYCDAKFNNDYPVELISVKDGYKKWVWEYFDIDTFDKNLQDVLIVTESALPDCTPNWECVDWKEKVCSPNFNISNEVDMHFGGLYDLEDIVEGKMHRYCNNGCGNSRIEYKNCPKIDACEIIGIRQSGKYCSNEKVWITQKSPNGVICENNFECKNNLCVNGSCQSKKPTNILYWAIGIGVITIILIIVIVVPIILFKKKS